MKAYVITTAVLFGVMAILHGWRAVVERPAGHEETAFIAVTVITAVLCIWAIRLLVRRSNG
jgi:succinate dehydrogenase/fumarate reductase cytochrome b subunit